MTVATLTIRVRRNRVVIFERVVPLNAAEYGAALVDLPMGPAADAMLDGNAAIREHGFGKRLTIFVKIVQAKSKAGKPPRKRRVRPAAETLPAPEAVQA